MVKHLTVCCPKCGSDDLTPRGISGSRQNAGGQTAAGFLGQVIGSAFDTKGYNPALHEEIEYKCNACKNHFFVEKNAERSKKDFDIPFKINFSREKKFVGAVMIQVVYLNGVRKGEVKNGQSIQFKTYKRKNVIVVTGPNGDAFPDFLSFEATEGGSKNVRFALKFIE